jgi:hypothetical protein
LSRSYNPVRVPAGAKEGPRDAQATLRAASIDLVWRDCVNGGCEEPLGARDLIVRIVAAPRGVGLDELGYSMVDLQERIGTLATVYSDRAALLAERARVETGKVLGRAVAHEVGHMLLGTSRHSATGLMRASWLDREVRREFGPDWTWSGRISGSSRVRAVNRTASCGSPIGCRPHAGADVPPLFK